MYVNYITSAANVNSRPIQYLTLNARYRYNSRNDFTRPFHAVEYVRMDAVPEETGGDERAVQDQPQHVRPQRDAARRSRSAPSGSATATTGTSGASATTEGWKDKTFRVSFDTASLRFVTLRAGYEDIARDAVDLDPDGHPGASATSRRCGSTTRRRATATASR